MFKGLTGTVSVRLFFKVRTTYFLIETMICIKCLSNFLLLRLVVVVIIPCLSLGEKELSICSCYGLKN